MVEIIKHVFAAIGLVISATAGVYFLNSNAWAAASLAGAAPVVQAVR